MVIRLTKGLSWDGRTYAPMDLVLGLSPQREAELIRGGDAAAVTDLDLPPSFGLNSDDVGRIKSLVSGDGISDAEAIAGVDKGDALGTARLISDGSNTGARVRWYTPAGYSAPRWCWDLYPQSVYEG